MKNKRFKLLIILAAVFGFAVVVSLTLTFSAPSVLAQETVKDKAGGQVKMNADGTVTVDGMTFADSYDYHHSDYFRLSGRRCGTDRRRKLNPGADFPAGSTSDCNLTQTVIKNEYYPSVTYTIPVVFHVITGNGGTGNISDQRITDQIKVLNEDFGAQAGTLGANGYNTKIQFNHAGTTRTQNNSWYNDGAGFQASLGWDTTKYLNVYTGTAGGDLGYSSFPPNDAGSTTDGIVMLHSTIGGRDNGNGAFDQGRTLVHEAGHYLGLEHTFNGGCGSGYTAGDRIADTNPESTAHYGCSPSNTCGSSDPITNYMNYTDDTCMEEFTQEQANRMICSLLNWRPNLASSGGGGGGGGSSAVGVNRTTLYFSAVVSGSKTGNQTVWVSNTGSGTLNWTAGANKSWLSVSPSSGTNGGSVTVSVDHSGLSAGSYSGTVTVSDSNTTSSKTVTVNLTVINSGAEEAPFGSFSTPVSGSTVSSSIAVTGWVIDDIGVSRVEISNGDTYVGDAVFVEGARPDVENAYPGYPNNYRAGWGYMMLTNFLPGGGNGTYTLYADAIDTSGNVVTLGSKTITVDNANAVKPFGAIDAPGQGGTASGASFVNWGWVLTPQPNMIPTSGSTIKVWVNGVNKGSPAYNNYRSDIATLFPSYANSNGAIGYKYLDTTGYDNGIHTIQWTATDDDGNSDGIGSRYFNIQNSGNDAARGRRAYRPSSGVFRGDLSKLKTDVSLRVRFKTGYESTASMESLGPDQKGSPIIEIRELGRVEVHFFPEGATSTVLLPVSPLPIGSTFEEKGGIFYWQPGAGFVGDYEFMFIDTNSQMLRKLTIRILPNGQL
ncbi:MAG: hypothetical protein GY940_48115 [bacterium]|nr:hypothetical protein [bacterium]